jgi:hypothetical protein
VGSSACKLDGLPFCPLW